MDVLVNWRGHEELINVCELLENWLICEDIGTRSFVLGRPMTTVIPSEKNDILNITNVTEKKWKI
ncbi:hypothetical protein CHS0354_015071 [Potamilus streckersoni]|uniref:Uncharacterized protein n=1 Tax=Potamilus streckersoni TaxID=2493646 RepID=A0AAE0TGF5_9BIVA|nr:hypothetical protein CHS0354_015071 [Potamilus streckersoni]